MYHKPFSQACENNQQPIGDCLKDYVSQPGQLLEVGSGTGQHACYLSEKFPHLQWQPTDLDENLSGIQAWVDCAHLDNLLVPKLFDVSQNNISFGLYEYFFTANTMHIMSWETVEKLFAKLPSLLKPAALLFTYGAYKYSGQFTSESNEVFDQLLKSRAAHQGIRDVEAIQELASKSGISLLADHDLPANNRLLIWQFN